MSKKFLFGTMIIIFMMVPSFVYADIGPKPTASIHVTLNGQNVPDEKYYAKMLTCNNYELEEDENTIQQLQINEFDQQRNCYWRPDPMAWDRFCTYSNCSFGYFLPSKFKLAVFLPSQDKLYISKEVARENFNSRYKANLLPDGSMELEEVASLMQQEPAKHAELFLLAFILTLITESVIGFIFLIIAKLRKKILLSVFLGNLISLPIVWFIFPLLVKAPIVEIISLIFAIILESYIIMFLNKTHISLKKVFILSILMNIVSFAVGYLVLYILQLAGL